MRFNSNRMRRASAFGGERQIGQAVAARGGSRRAARPFYLTVSADRFLGLFSKEAEPLRDIGPSDLLVERARPVGPRARHRWLPPSVQQDLRSQGLHHIHDGVEERSLGVAPLASRRSLRTNTERDALLPVGGQPRRALGAAPLHEPRGFYIEPPRLP